MNYEHTYHTPVWCALTLYTAKYLVKKYSCHKMQFSFTYLSFLTQQNKVYSIIEATNRNMICPISTSYKLQHSRKCYI